MPNFADYLPQALLIFVLVGCLDWALGIAVALKAGVFDWRLIADQLQTVFLPYLAPMVLVAIMAPDWRGAIIAPAGAATIKLIADMRDKIIKLNGGEPPMLATEKPKRTARKTSSHK